jgi:hypothetical protein
VKASGVAGTSAGGAVAGGAGAGGVAAAGVPVVGVPEPPELVGVVAVVGFVATAAVVTT